MHTYCDTHICIIRHTNKDTSGQIDRQRADRPITRQITSTSAGRNRNCLLRLDFSMVSISVTITFPPGSVATPIMAQFFSISHPIAPAPTYMYIYSLYTHTYKRTDIIIHKTNYDNVAASMTRNGLDVNIIRMPTHAGWIRWLIDGRIDEPKVQSRQAEWWLDRQTRRML